MSISRRKLINLIGRGGVSLPLLNMIQPSFAQGSIGPKKRIIFLHSDSGANSGLWRPQQNPDGSLNLDFPNSVLSPLSGHKDKILTVTGLGCLLSKIDDQAIGGHESEIYALSGSKTQSISGLHYPTTDTLDQLIAEKLRNDTFYSDITIGESLSYGGGGVARKSSFHDPVNLYRSLFRISDNDPIGDLELYHQKLVAETNAQINQLNNIVGQEDKVRLAVYQESLAAIGRKISFFKLNNPVVDEPVLTSNRWSRLESFLELIYQAMVVDLSRVFSIGLNTFISNTADAPAAAGQYLDPNTGNPTSNLGSIHGGIDHSISINDVNNYSTQNSATANRGVAHHLANFCDKLAAYDEGGRSLLDNTIICWWSILSDPYNHSINDLPYTLIGGAGELAGTMRMGQSVDFSSVDGTGKKTYMAHNYLLTTLAQTMGLNRDYIGYSDFRGILPLT